MDTSSLDALGSIVLEADKDTQEVADDASSFAISKSEAPIHSFTAKDRSRKELDREKKPKVSPRSRKAGESDEPNKLEVLEGAQKSYKSSVPRSDMKGKKNKQNKSRDDRGGIGTTDNGLRFHGAEVNSTVTVRTTQ